MKRSGPDVARTLDTQIRNLLRDVPRGRFRERARKERPFAEKRDMLGGFAQSTLRLNQGLGRPSGVERGNDPSARDAFRRVSAAFSKRRMMRRFIA
ncbi:MAG TPA: hypothetical protein VF713_09405 [Thermoanaerobaculia bacterium]